MTFAMGVGNHRAVHLIDAGTPELAVIDRNCGAHDCLRYANTWSVSAGILMDLFVFERRSGRPQQSILKL